MAVSFSDLPDGALVLLDSAPIIHFLEGHPEHAGLLRPLFEAHARGRLRFAVTTTAIADVLAGPLSAGDEALTARYRTILESWQVVELSADIAERSARLRLALRLKQPDAVQVASAIAINADALIALDRDFSRATSLRVLP